MDTDKFFMSLENDSIIMLEAMLEHWTKILKEVKIELNKKNPKYFSNIKINSLPNGIKYKPMNNCWACQYFDVEHKGCNNCNDMFKWHSYGLYRSMHYCVNENTLYENIKLYYYQSDPQCINEIKKLIRRIKTILNQELKECLK